MRDSGAARSARGVCQQRRRHTCYVAMLRSARRVMRAQWRRICRRPLRRFELMSLFFAHAATPSLLRRGAAAQERLICYAPPLRRFCR